MYKLFVFLALLIVAIQAGDKSRGRGTRPSNTPARHIYRLFEATCPAATLTYPDLECDQFFQEVSSNCGGPSSGLHEITVTCGTNSVTIYPTERIGVARSIPSYCPQCTVEYRNRGDDPAGGDPGYGQDDFDFNYGLDMDGDGEDLVTTNVDPALVECLETCDPNFLDTFLFPGRDLYHAFMFLLSDVPCASTGCDDDCLGHVGEVVTQCVSQFAEPPQWPEFANDMTSSYQPTCSEWEDFFDCARFFFNRDRNDDGVSDAQCSNYCVDFEKSCVGSCIYSAQETNINVNDALDAALNFADCPGVEFPVVPQEVCGLASASVLSLALALVAALF